jgi:hypothetical protein
MIGFTRGRMRVIASCAELSACPCRKSNTNVVMMHAAEHGPRFDAPEGVNWSPRRRILVQGQVGSAPIVVARITAQQMEKMATRR